MVIGIDKFRDHFAGYTVDKLLTPETDYNVLRYITPDVIIHK